MPFRAACKASSSRVGNRGVAFLENVLHPPPHALPDALVCEDIELLLPDALVCEDIELLLPDGPEGATGHVVRRYTFLLSLEEGLHSIFFFATQALRSTVLLQLSLTSERRLQNWSVDGPRAENRDLDFGPLPG